MPIVSKALIVWFAILVLAFANGLLREAWLVPRLGLRPGLVISGVLLCLAILLVTALTLPWLDLHATGELIVLGIGWLLLTLAFEWSFGLLRGKSIAELAQAYAFTDGNLWSLVLLVTALAPWLAAQLRVLA